MLGYPPDESLILVGIMPHPRDLEVARLLGWYRIPMRSAPKVVNVDYLAFYQTGAFGKDHRWQIESGFRDLNRISPPSNARTNIRKLFMFSVRFWVYNACVSSYFCHFGGL